MPKRSRSGSMSKDYKNAKKKKQLAIREPDRLLSPYASTMIGRSDGFPRLLKFKHRYSTKSNVTAAGTLSSVQFRCNGMYDPDYTAVGHQPLYFDQVGAIYNHFYVLRAQIKFTIVPQGTTAQYPYRASAVILDDTSVPVSLDDIAEQKGATTKLCTGGLNPSKEVLTLTYDAQKYWGNNLLANSRQRGSTSADPSEQSFAALVIAPLDNSSTCTLHVLTEIMYTAIWCELKPISGS